MIAAWQPRLARPGERAELEALITLSVETLQAAHYNAEQRAAAMGPVFGVDAQLIADGTYFAVESPQGEIIGCGGWSKRQSLYGGREAAAGPAPELVPGRDPARVRAFFVHPAWARQGIGSAILRACEEALTQAGFTDASLAATLPGVPLYAARGYVETERFDITLPNGLPLPCVRMVKSFG